MLGKLLGLKEIAEKKRLLNNTNCLLVLGIFFEDWYSIKEASKIFNPKLSDSERNDRTVNYYFYKIKKFEWLEDEIVLKTVIRKSKLGKKSKYPHKCLRYRLNFEPYFIKYYDTPLNTDLRFNKLRKKLIPYLTKNRKVLTQKSKNKLDYIFTLAKINHHINKRFNRIY